MTVDGLIELSSPTRKDVFGKINVCLAIGTEAQIQFLIEKRRLKKLNIPKQLPISFKKKKDTLPKLVDGYDTRIAPIFPLLGQVGLNALVGGNANDSSNTTAVKGSKLTSTIRKASAADTSKPATIVTSPQLTAAGPSSNASATAITSPPSNATVVKNPEIASQIRKTSDLLDSLHAALTQPPNSAAFQNILKSPISQMSSTPTPIQTPSPILSAIQSLKTSKSTPSTSLNSIAASELSSSIVVDQSQVNNLKPLSIAGLFKVSVFIENAMYLRKAAPKMNKRPHKTNSKSAKHNHRNSTEIPPNTYVMFQSTIDILSNKLETHCTDIVERNCFPEYNTRFDVMLPVELLTNVSVFQFCLLCNLIYVSLQVEKRFILKMFRTNDTNQSSQRKQPSPMDDQCVGSILVDLSVLVCGFPMICGWFHISSYDGHANGQIKISVQPLENIDKYSVRNMKKAVAVASEIEPLSIDTNLGLNNSYLSRALKRKFTELEEITARLKTRLQDVTADEDDEFEKDLNTEVDDDVDLELDDYAWLSNDELYNMKNSNLSDKKNEPSSSLHNNNIVPPKYTTTPDYKSLIEIFQNIGLVERNPNLYAKLVELSTSAPQPPPSISTASTSSAASLSSSAAVAAAPFPSPIAEAFALPLPPPPSNDRDNDEDDSSHVVPLMKFEDNDDGNNTSTTILSPSSASTSTSTDTSDRVRIISEALQKIAGKLEERQSHI